jgi:hypothetical protein
MTTETRTPAETAERAELIQTLIGQAHERIAKLKQALSMTEGVIRSHNRVIAFENDLCIDIQDRLVTNQIIDILDAPRVQPSEAEGIRLANIRNGAGEQALLRFDRDVLQSQLDKSRRHLDWLNGLDA